MTWEMKFLIGTTVISLSGVAAMYIISYLMGREVRIGLYTIGMISFIIIFTFINVRVSLERGVKLCRKCKSESSLNARYCIHCGKKIRWFYKTKW
jgi:hypothetical protein